MDVDKIYALILLKSVLIIFFILWNRSESRADIRHMDLKLEAKRELVRAIHEEIKDFHRRLLEVEKRNRS